MGTISPNTRMSGVMITSEAMIENSPNLSTRWFSQVAVERTFTETLAMRMVMSVLRGEARRCCTRLPLAGLFSVMWAMSLRLREKSDVSQQEKNADSRIRTANPIRNAVMVNYPTASLQFAAAESLLEGTNNLVVKLPLNP